MNQKKTTHNTRTIPRKYHIVFWLGYFSFNVLRWGSYFDDYWYSLKSNLVEFPLHILLVYANLYYFIPKFLIQKKYKRYIVSIVGSLTALYIVRTALTYLLVTKNIWPEAAAGQEAFSLNHIIAVTLGEFYVLAVATAIKLTIDWVQQRQRIENLKKEQLKSELNFLKAQIQPHFFFNTLNNLYALTLEKSNQAPSVVLKLSDIMQYVIYDIAAPKVPLLKEIEYLQNYIDLERFRCHENATIECSIDGDVTGVEVPPMIFLPYLENSFKHGNKYSDDFYIYISFEKTSEKQLVFRITNSLHPSDHSSTAGIGNNNTQRRLDLLYGNKHTLTINSSTNSFEVSLKLPLTLNDTK